MRFPVHCRVKSRLPRTHTLVKRGKQARLQPVREAGKLICARPHQLTVSQSASVSRAIIILLLVVLVAPAEIIPTTPISPLQSHLPIIYLLVPSVVALSCGHDQGSGTFLPMHHLSHFVFVLAAKRINVVLSVSYCYRRNQKTDYNFERGLINAQFSIVSHAEGGTTKVH